MGEWLRGIGIEVSILIAGMAGGLASVTQDNKSSYWTKFTTIFSGGLVSNYLSPLVLQISNLPSEANYGISFIVGYMGLKSVEWVIERLTSKKI